MTLADAAGDTVWVLREELLGAAPLGVLCGGEAKVGKAGKWDVRLGSLFAHKYVMEQGINSPLVYGKCKQVQFDAAEACQRTVPHTSAWCGRHNM